MNNREVIDKALTKLQNSMWRDNIINGIILSLLLSAVVCLGIVLTAHLMIIAYVVKKCFLAVITICLSGLFFGIFRRPSLKSAAMKGDSLGLMDRLITYIEYNDKDSWLIEMFIQELSDMLKSSQMINKYSGRIMWKKLAIAVFIYALTSAVYFAPSVYMDKGIKAQTINEELREEAKKVDLLSQELQKDEKDKEEYAKEANDVLKELSKKLGKEFDFDKAVGDISMAIDEIERIEGKRGTEAGEALDLMLQGIEGAASASEGIQERFSALNCNEEQQKKMLENIKKMKTSGNPYSKAFEKTLDEIQTELEKGQLNAEKLEKLMKPFFEDKKDFSEAEKIETKLDEMKERLMAKEEGGIEEAGEEKAEAFAHGENSELGQGEEASIENSKKVASGGSGSQTAKNPESMGGGITGGAEASQAESSLGQLHRKASEIESEGGKKADNINSSWQDKAGTVTNKFSDDVMQSKGEASKLEEMYKSFGDNPLEYSRKFDIQEEFRPLVVEYFKRLNGGK